MKNAAFTLPPGRPRHRRSLPDPETEEKKEYRKVVCLLSAILALSAFGGASQESAARAGKNAPQDALVVSAGPTAKTVNVMRNAKPPIPTFPKPAPQPGYARGYVHDTRGNPLAGARIGVRSTAAGCRRPL